MVNQLIGKRSMFKCSDEKFKTIVKNSICISEALRKLGVRVHSHYFAKFHEKIKQLSLDISHFDKYHANNIHGAHDFKYKPLLDYLANGGRHNSTIKNKLIKESYKKNQCESCSLSDWMDKNITLELHHIDGNRDNNEINNLQILCPNCHSQTPNYKNKQRVKTF